MTRRSVTAGATKDRTAGLDNRSTTRTITGRAVTVPTKPNIANKTEASSLDKRKSLRPTTAAIPPATAGRKPAAAVSKIDTGRSTRRSVATSSLTQNIRPATASQTPAPSTNAVTRRHSLASSAKPRAGLVTSAEVRKGMLSNEAPERRAQAQRPSVTPSKDGDFKRPPLPPPTNKRSAAVSKIDTGRGTPRVSRTASVGQTPDIIKGISHTLNVTPRRPLAPSNIINQSANKASTPRLSLGGRAVSAPTPKVPTTRASSLRLKAAANINK